MRKHLFFLASLFLLAGILPAQTRRNGSLVVDGGINYFDDTGVANVYSGSVGTALGGYAKGATFCFLAGNTNTNTGASTVNINSIGDVSIRRLKNQALVDPDPGDIAAGQLTCVQYDGAVFQLQSRISESLFITPGCTFDNTGSTVAVNSICYARVRSACVLDPSFSIVAIGTAPTATFDVFKAASGTLLPTASIVSSGAPALSTGNAVVGNTTWTTTTVSPDDMLAFKVTAVANASWLSITLKCQYSQ